MLIRRTSRKQNCSMRSNVTKVTAAYAISRTTPKVAYFGVREDKTFFFSFHTDFLLKGQMTYRYTCIVCPDISSRDSKRAKHVIPIHTNIITLETKRLQFRLSCHTYICIRCRELVKKR
jgi:hypothetical protein